MVCRYIRFPNAGSPATEWVPMALVPGICLLRRSDPGRWTQKLHELGVEVDETDLTCRQNLDGAWLECPLCRERAPAPRFLRDDEPRNEHGFPLFL